MSEVSAGPDDALVVVDLQNDFCPGGALAVPEGDQIGPLVNRLLAHPRLFKVTTRDWHPADHISFEAQGGIWPPHCVKDTPGAGFHPLMEASREKVFAGSRWHSSKMASVQSSSRTLSHEL